MSKTKPPMAQCPLVALAEQARVQNVAHAILLVRTADGHRAMFPLDGSDPDILAGLMAWATTAIMAEAPDDDDDE